VGRAFACFLSRRNFFSRFYSNQFISESVKQASKAKQSRATLGIFLSEGALKTLG
jgi:hypothetical protein